MTFENPNSMLYTDMAFNYTYMIILLKWIIRNYINVFHEMQTFHEEYALDYIILA